MSTFDRYGESVSAEFPFVGLILDTTPGGLSAYVPETGRIWAPTALSGFIPPKTGVGPTVMIFDPITETVTNSITSAPPNWVSISCHYIPERTEVHVYINETPGGPASVNGLWIFDAVTELPKRFIAQSVGVGFFTTGGVYIPSLDLVYSFYSVNTGVSQSFEIMDPNTGALGASGVVQSGVANAVGGPIYFPETDLVYYSAPGGTDSIRAWDYKTNTIVATTVVTAGGNIRLLEYVPTVERFYAGNARFGGTFTGIEIYDPFTFSITGTIVVAYNVIGLEYNPNNEMLYAAHSIDLGPGVGDVYEYDPNTNLQTGGPSPASGVFLPQDAFAMIYAPNADRLLVWNSESNPPNVSIMDPNNLTVDGARVLVGAHEVVGQSPAYIINMCGTAETTAVGTDIYLEQSRDGSSWTRVSKIRLEGIGYIEKEYKPSFGIICRNGCFFRVVADQTTGGFVSAEITGRGLVREL